MAITLFKSGDQLYDLGLDAIKRKDWREARNCFNDSIRKGGSKVPIAEVMLALLQIPENRENVGNYQNIINTLESAGVSEFTFGLMDIDSEKLKLQCKLSIDEINVMALSDDDYEEKGPAMIRVAGDMAANIGDSPLLLIEMFDGKGNRTGTREANILQAMAYEIMGRGVVREDPKKAAGYMQMAATFRKMLGETGDEDMELSRQYSNVGKCWFCGRTVSGEGINFFTVDSIVNEANSNETANEVIRSFTSDRHSVYVCAPCYMSISTRANEISREYYDRAMAEMRAMEARLQAQIAHAEMVARIN